MDSVVTVLAAALMLSKDVRSSSRNLMMLWDVEGSVALISLMVVSALLRVRAARYIVCGECLARAAMVARPRPMLPPVTMITWEEGLVGVCFEGRYMESDWCGNVDGGRRSTHLSLQTYLSRSTRGYPYRD